MASQLRSKLMSVMVVFIIGAYACGMSFKFGDKGADFGTYIKELAGLVKDGKKQEAIQYAETLLTEYQKAAEAQLKAPVKEGEKKPDPKNLADNICYLTLVKANVLYQTGRLRMNEWLEAYKEESKKCNNPQKVFKDVASLPEPLLSTEMADALLHSGIVPIETQSLLSKRSFDISIYKQKKPNEIWDEFYANLSSSPTVEEKAFAIGKYSYILNECKQGDKINDALWNIINLSENEKLKIAAGENILLRCTTTVQANEAVLDMHKRVKSPAFQEYFKTHLIMALASSGDTADAIAVMSGGSGGGETQLPETPDEIAQKIYDLEKLPQPQIAGYNRYWLATGKIMLQMPRASELTASLAENLFTQKKYAMACNVAMLSIGETAFFPIDLTTAKPLKTLNEIQENFKCQPDESFAAYLIAQAYFGMSNFKKAEEYLLLSKVDTAKMPVFYANVELLKVRLLRFLKDSKWTDEGLRKSVQTLDSPVLRTYLEILNTQADPKNSVAGAKK